MTFRHIGVQSMLFNYYQDYRRQCGCIKLQIERPTGAWREAMQGYHLKSTFGTAYYNYSGLAGMLGRALCGRLCLCMGAWSYPGLHYNLLHANQKER